MCLVSIISIISKYAFIRPSRYIWNAFSAGLISPPVPLIHLYILRPINIVIQLLTGDTIDLQIGPNQTAGQIKSMIPIKEDTSSDSYVYRLELAGKMLDEADVLYGTLCPLPIIALLTGDK